MNCNVKKYVLMVSEKFPQYHHKHGIPTNFIKKIKNDIKIHTIRSNVKLWIKRINEIKKGKAVLSVRVWTGKPYQSKQKIICNLMSTVGYEVFNYKKSTVNGRPVDLKIIAKNDGLTINNFKSWFYPYRKDEEMIIIHFTDFRYSKGQK